MESLLEKAKKIRLVIFDVDGVLTSGQITYGSQGTEYKTFHVHDGLGIKLLLQSKIAVAIITSRESDIVTRRAKELGIPYVFQKCPNKMPAYLELKKQLHLPDETIAYVGDDLPDLALIRLAGLGITVANAPSYIQQHADWVTHKKGGKGVAREVSEFILQAQGSLDTLIQNYLEP